tara:strand:- start:134 stop:493 length:360 start_codon:yes stop_codon:yes gene_type:complete
VVVLVVIALILTPVILEMLVDLVAEAEAIFLLQVEQLQQDKETQVEQVKIHRLNTVVAVAVQVVPVQLDQVQMLVVLDYKIITVLAQIFIMLAVAVAQLEQLLLQVMMVVLAVEERERM